MVVCSGKPDKPMVFCDDEGFKKIARLFVTDFDRLLEQRKQQASKDSTPKGAVAVQQSPPHLFGCHDCILFFCGMYAG